VVSVMVVMVVLVVTVVTVKAVWLARMHCQLTGRAQIRDG
jgi:hypothetical protein